MRLNSFAGAAYRKIFLIIASLFVVTDATPQGCCVFVLGDCLRNCENTVKFKCIPRPERYRPKFGSCEGYRSFCIKQCKDTAEMWRERGVLIR